jgi:hypothetical protein
VNELKEYGEKFGAIEQKMMSGQALNSDEQDLYDVSSREGIDEKVTWLEANIKTMVDEGQLTMGEKAQLLNQMDAKIKSIESEIDVSTKEGKAKKVEKLAAQLTNVTSRRDFVKTVEPIIHPLKHEEKILQLKMMIIPLVKLEEAPGLRSMEEMKKIGTRPDMEDEVAKLETESRGWFEEDADFQARCAKIGLDAQKKYEKAEAAKKKGGGSGKSQKAEDQWETVSSMGSGSANKGKRR